MHQNNLLPGFKPSEADLFDMAVAVPLDQKIEKAINFLKMYGSKDPLYVAFSGGKDSEVIKQLCIEAGIEFEAYYNNVTIDPPELIYHIKRNHSDVKWNNPKKNLFARIVEKANPPTRKGRWCCAEFKEQGGNSSNKVIGVRALESPRRKMLWKQVNYHRKTGKMILAPIIYWSEEDVWNFIRDRNLKYCCLYDEGFKRLGCIGCPLGGPNNQRKEFDRWPNYERLWKRAFYRLWNRWHGVPNRKGKPRFFEAYGTPENFWEWWISGEAYNDDPEQSQCTFEDILWQ